MRKRKSYSKMLFGVIPAIIIFAGGIAYFYVHTHSADNSIIYEEGVSRLKALEASDISQIEKQLQELEQNSQKQQDSDIQKIIAEDGRLTVE